MKINKSKREYKLKDVRVGDCFRDEYGEIYIKSDLYDVNNGILCVSLEHGETQHYDGEEKVEHLPNACLNIEG